VKTAGAYAVAFDSKRNPALIINKRKGVGSTILVTHPIEQYVGNVPDTYLKDKTYKIYDALRTESGMTQPYACDSPFIEVGWTETKEKDEALLTLINHERISVHSAISLEGMWQAEDLATGKKVQTRNKANRTYVSPSFRPSEARILSLKHIPHRT
jgi:hypothetical protein